MTDAAPRPDAAASDAEKRRKSRGILARVGFSLLAVLVLVLAAVGSEPYWMPVVQPLLSPSRPSPDAQKAIEARLDAIAQKIDALSAANSSLTRRIEALENRPVSTDSSAPVAALQDKVQQMSSRLDRVDAQLSQLVKNQAARGDSAARVLIVALANLGNAVSSSQPYGAQLASVAALGENRPGWAAALHPLEAAAKTGLPSTAILAQRFSSDVAPAILRAHAAAPNPHESLGQAVLSKLRSLVIIRRVGGTGQSADPVEAAVDTASAALRGGDLAGAVKALQALTGAAAQAAAPWLKVAQQRLQAEQTIAKLTQEVAADHATGTNGG